MFLPEDAFMNSFRSLKTIPARPSEHADAIGDPDLVGMTNSEAFDTVQRDRFSVAAVGGGVTILGALPCKESFGTHAPGYAIAPSVTT